MGAQLMMPTQFLELVSMVGGIDLIRCNSYRCVGTEIQEERIKKLDRYEEKGYISNLTQYEQECADPSTGTRA